MRRRQKTQHKEVTQGKSSREPGCALAGGSRGKRMLGAMQGPPLYLGSPRRPDAQLLSTPPRPLPVLHPRHCPLGPRRQLLHRWAPRCAAAQPGPSSARSLALSPPPGCNPRGRCRRGVLLPAAGEKEPAAWGVPSPDPGFELGFSWLRGLCVATKRRQQRGCALQSVTIGRGGERKYLCYLKMKFPTSV